jgi:hypothetical protein
VICLDTIPIPLFQVGGYLKDLSTRRLELGSNSARGGIIYLHRICNPTIERSESSAELLDQLGSFFMSGLSDKVVQVVFIGLHYFSNTVGGVLP